MDKMHAKRLLKLAALLDTVPRKEFDVRHWKYETPCSTTACACGWAATVPSFKAAGLLLSSLGEDDGEKCYDLIFSPRSTNEREQCRSRWLAKTSLPYDYASDEYEDLAAAEMFFGVTGDEAFNLFHPSGYDPWGKATPKQVAAKIRKTVKEYHPELLTAAA